MRETLIALAIAALGVLGVSFVRAPLAKTAHDVKQTTDVYVLPPPAQLKVMTLGYRAAAADLLWAKLLVEYGMHWFDKREFKDTPKYADAIIELEPSHPLLYRYIDTLLAYRPLRGTKEDAILARQYLERGTRERPHDPKVWLEYGEFVAFMAPSFLDTQEEREAWRRDGAMAMFRAVELGADPDRALSAATIVNKAGERETAIRQLKRQLALTDPEDVETREAFLAKLRMYESDADDRDIQFIEKAWREWAFRRGRYLMHPLLSRGEFLMVGPFHDTARCAGVPPPPECEREWDALLPSQKAVIGR